MQARLPVWLNRTLRKMPSLPGHPDQRTRPSVSSVKPSTARWRSRRADPTTRTAAANSRGRTVRWRAVGNSAARAASVWPESLADHAFHAQRDPGELRPLYCPCIYMPATRCFRHSSKMCGCRNCSLSKSRPPTRCWTTTRSPCWSACCSTSSGRCSQAVCARGINAVLGVVVQRCFVA